MGVYTQQSRHFGVLLGILFFLRSPKLRKSEIAPSAARSVRRLRETFRVEKSTYAYTLITIFVLIYLDVTIFGVNVFVTGQEIITNNGPFVGGSTCFIKIWLILSSASWELKRDFVKFPVYALVLVFFNKH
ncbi:hypothetical protein ANTQUA_LOCUS2536 [Anthophora quadrimaculata]